MRQARRSMWRVFAVPALLAMVSVLGLIAALLSNEPADWLWDACIAAPLVVTAMMMSRGFDLNRPSR